ncbi:ibr domain-containing protein [Diplodia corticola]|uniref:RBR-type E3 ubiquitin transferase n=1 Tax=Diplodia corticola TaxID=236234 RepID=A0A1J9S5Q2_9PEZI|nr:ibr domain-containing protein [Diplodia corticola]OJD40283.1 ibr domain-containing protein [Diplodia corticola]
MAANRRFAHLLDGMGAIFATRPRDNHAAYDSDSYHRPRPSRRPRRNTIDHDTRYLPAHAAPPPQPDLDHLRQARADYFLRPPEIPDPRSARRPSAASVALSSHPPTPPPPPVPDLDMVQRAASTRKTSKPKRQHQDDRRPSRKEREDRDSGVYVYSTPRSGDSRSRRDEDLADTRSRAGHRRTVSSPATNVIDVEVEREADPAPEPSLHRTEAVRLNRTMSSRDSARPAVVMTRPSLRRTGTLKTPPDEVPPPTPSQSHQRKNSGILGLFRHVPPPAQTPEKKYDCMVCMDEVRASRCPKLSCGHRMCHTCLKRQFELSVRDPQHMPPRCCTTEHIPLKYVERLFDTKFKVLWNKKYQEYTAKNRVYCPTRGCGEWIKPSHIRMDATVGRKYGKCPRCRVKVCVKCNNRWHLRKECPKDDDEEAHAFAEMAKESGWQKCYNCKAMVELKEGCNHMTCRCTAQFCMLCGARWKTCECPWFNYQHLDDDDRLQNMRVAEPYVVVERDRPDAIHAPPPPRPLQNPTRPEQYAVPAPRLNYPVYAPEDTRPATSRTARTFYAPDRDRDLEHEREREREREDEMLARRLQSEFLADAADAPGRTGSIRGGSLSRSGGGGGSHRRHHHHHRNRTAPVVVPPSRYDSPELEIEVMGVGNASGHHMNDFGLPGAAAVAASRQQQQQAPPPRSGATAAVRRSNTTRSTITRNFSRREPPPPPADTSGRYAATAEPITVTTTMGGNNMTTQYQYQYARQQQRPSAAVEASVMAGLGDPARSGMGRVGMWLNYVENDPAEVEGRAAARAASGAGAGMVGVAAY